MLTCMLENDGYLQMMVISKSSVYFDFFFDEARHHKVKKVTDLGF